MENTRLVGLTDQEILKEGRKIAQSIEGEIRNVVYGPEIQNLIDILITAIFADGHVIVRAPVGLAKTTTCSALARTIGGKFTKRQFRPDMLPSELSGFEIYNQKTHEFEVRHGPLFGANIFLADEINRGTPKAQAALLEAMQERELTVGTNVYKLEPLFLVLATRNPMEHEGTYHLPEAQLDRFFAQPIIPKISKQTLKIVLSKPDYWQSTSNRLEGVSAVTNPEEILTIRKAIFKHIHVEERLIEYITSIIDATHNNSSVEFGSSVRGGENLQKAAQVAAFRAGRDFAEPADVQRYAVDILAHRIFLKPNVRLTQSPASIIREVLDEVKYD